MAGAADLSYGTRMRATAALFILLLAACSKQSAAPAGNEQTVIDKANADVAAAQAQAQAKAAVQPQPAR
ncbi:hypothetical protein [Sandarakinorhabdus sp.]|uniref:hypothetical protein n=1 Tax=Sandarakinorhabdus sp. TaxID=1916663 RepID=UPI00333EC1FA